MKPEHRCTAMRLCGCFVAHSLPHAAYRIVLPHHVSSLLEAKNCNFWCSLYGLQRYARDDIGSLLFKECKILKVGVRSPRNQKL
jgi:hypothetical protein